MSNYKHYLFVSLPVFPSHKSSILAIFFYSHNNPPEEESTDVFFSRDCDTHLLFISLALVYIVALP